MYSTRVTYFIKSIQTLDTESVDCTQWVESIDFMHTATDSSESRANPEMGALSNQGSLRPAITDLTTAGSERLASSLSRKVRHYMNLNMLLK
ncbi:hypothetical protein RRG08_027988 [Elysia crispata]|uniref:Uncharacterized protein n=1 Tax=Elysia crispata TaxID=231223 RepID=A0AAE1BCN4_9GAST|nr:hypothetical protein RRG08_027988 [Elysia crispata]